jgi:Leucine-rich repeat (LRR) protein
MKKIQLLFTMKKHHFIHTLAVVLLGALLTVGCSKSKPDPEPEPPQPPVLTDLQKDSTALVELHNATAGAGWTSKWTLAAPLRQWHGVTVKNGRVAELNLPANNLQGTLPESFGDLTALEYCDLSVNRLGGAVPATLYALVELEFLDLSDNALSGALPALHTLRKLIVLDVSLNTFTALPALSSLTALEYLAFSKNNLPGTLPENWSALTKLIYIDGSFNALSGEIPAAWSALTKLEALYLYRNALSGSLPACFGDFAELKSLALDGNNFTGAIPGNWGSQTKLETLWLAQNRLNGSIPASLSGNARWDAWAENVCPQQSDYGFDNCTTPGGNSASATKAAQCVPDGHAYKAKYGQRSTVNGRRCRVNGQR